MATTKRHVPARRSATICFALALAVLLAGCARNSAGLTTGGSPAEGIVSEVPSQRVCGSEFPLEGPSDLARKSEKVVVARFVGLTPSAATSTAEKEDPDANVYRFAAMEFEVEDQISGSSESKVMVLTIQDLVNSDGKVLSTVSPCATADFSGAKAGDEFLLFLSRSNQSANFDSLFSASGVAQVVDGKVAAVGTGYDISTDEAKAHVLSPLVGQTVEEIRAQLPK